MTSPVTGTVRNGYGNGTARGTLTWLVRTGVFILSRCNQLRHDAAKKQEPVRDRTA